MIHKCFHIGFVTSTQYIMLPASRTLYYVQRRNNMFARLISRKNKAFDPRRKTVVTEQERYCRAFVFASYGLFVFGLFVPGSNYATKSKDYDDFFAKNGERDGITTLESGLQYKILKDGYGEKPQNRRQSVSVHYEGSLLDGTIFTTTKYTKKPIKFSLNSVIPGIAESVSTMKIGEERQIFIPSDLAYSRNGKLNTDSLVNIPPNTPIMFNIQLIGIDQS